MIALCKAEDVRIISDGADGWITVPDIKVPPGVMWNAYAVLGQDATVVHFENETKRVSTLWHGPHTIGAGTYYFVDAPIRVLQALKNQLGDASVRPLIKALRLSLGLRRWCKNNGFRVVRNSAGRPVSILPPLVICGTNPIDLDGEELDEAEELLDLEN